MKSSNFSFGDRVGALIFVGMIAYFTIYFSFFIWLSIHSFRVENFNLVSSATGAGSVVLMAIPFAIIGFPIAWLFCLVFGLPVWIVIEKIFGESAHSAVISGIIVWAFSLFIWLPMFGVSFENFEKFETWVILIFYQLFCGLIGGLSYKFGCNIRKDRLELHP